ncbi:MAG: hypothetical protein ACFE8N_05695 [Promethearchaeota archaeon]
MILVWGGSLNKEGSDYIRKIRDADNVIKFLEALKEEADNKDRESISAVIEIIIKHVSKISERGT